MYDGGGGGDGYRSRGIMSIYFDIVVAIVKVCCVLIMVMSGHSSSSYDVIGGTHLGG